MRITQSQNIQEKLVTTALAAKIFCEGLDTSKCWGKLGIPDKHIVLAFLFQAIMFNVFLDIIVNRGFYGKTITGNKGNVLGINMTYLLLHMLVMTLIRSPSKIRIMMCGASIIK